MHTLANRLPVILNVCYLPVHNFTEYYMYIASTKTLHTKLKLITHRRNIHKLGMTHSGLWVLCRNTLSLAKHSAILKY